MLWPGVAEELLAGKAFFVRDGVFKDVDAVIFTHVGDNLSDRLGPAVRAPAWSRSSTPSTARARIRRGRRGAASRALDARRADGHRLEHAARASAPRAALALRHHRRRRPAQRRPVGGDGLVLFPRAELRQDPRKTSQLGNDIADGAAKMTDTTVTQPHRRHRRAAAFQPADRRGRPGQHQRGRPAEMDARRAGVREGGADQLGGRQDRGARDRRSTASSRRTRRPKSGGSDDIGDISWTVPTITLPLPVEHPGPARPQLVQRDRDGDADRAQGRGGGRQGDGDDHASTC